MASIVTAEAVMLRFPLKNWGRDNNVLPRNVAEEWHWALELILGAPETVSNAHKSEIQMHSMPSTTLRLHPHAQQRNPH